jgi:hypothetical protein
LIKPKIGQMKSRPMTARLTAYSAVHLLDRGMACDAYHISALAGTSDPQLRDRAGTVEGLI